MKKQITFVVGDDWEGLYVDGKLEAQNNSLGAREVLRAIGLLYDCRVIDDIWLGELTTLPDNLADVVVQDD
jgi:hypothetical protein